MKRWLLSRIMRLDRIYLVITMSALGVLMTSCDSKTTTDTNTAVEVEQPKEIVESSSKAQLAIAVINSDTILGRYEYASKLRDDLTAQSVKFRGILRQKESALMAEMQQLQAEASSLSQFEGQTRQRLLYEKQEKLQLKQDEYSQKLLILEQQYNRDIDAAIKEYLDRYCEDKPYQMVLSNTDLGVIRWYSSSLDVTTEVLEGLNAEYQEQQAEMASEEK